MAGRPCGANEGNEGGGLLQKVDRDMQKWALKCSAVKINGEWVDVFKDPITDQVKRPRKVELLYLNQTGTISLALTVMPQRTCQINLLHGKTVLLLITKMVY